jgi:N-acetylated-alpha-linked acidic dipeptidase
MLLQFNGPYGVYHSVYDNHFWMSRFGDPGFRYHALMSQLWGVLALRLANADVLPHDFAAYARGIRGFLDELARANSELRARVDVKALRGALGEFERAGRDFASAANSALKAGALDAAKAAEVNARLRQVERNWLHDQGIPGRPWFKHLIYAARYTYAHLELPAITEAVEAKDWKLAQDQIAILERAVERNTQLLRQARKFLMEP